MIAAAHAEHKHCSLPVLQVLADAAAVDAKAATGASIEPLCGLPIAVKDSIDVLGYPTTASTPALLSKQIWQISCGDVLHAYDSAAACDLRHLSDTHRVCLCFACSAMLACRSFMCNYVYLQS